MSAFLLLAAVLQAGAGDSVRVRGGTRDSVVAIVSTPTGPALPAAAVVSLLGGSLRETGPGRWLLEAPGVTLDLTEGAPFARHGDEAIPIAGAPTRQNGVLLVPMQVLSDLVPRLGNNVVWDAQRREFRVFRSLVRRATPPPRSATPVTKTAGRPGGRGASSAQARVATEAASLPAPPPSAPPASSAPPPASSGTPRTARRHTVVVDAGHGGVDAGMRGPIGGSFVIREKDITLQVARRLADLLESNGVTVIMTRTTDTLIALEDRGRIANRNNGDLFISVHVNAANLHWKDPAGARGFETYFLAEAKTEDERRVAAMENEVVRFETNVAPPKDDALEFIMKDMAQNEHLRESSGLASAIQSRLDLIHPGPSRGVKQAGFMVLVKAYMPAVLVEIGFGTNGDEARWISGADGQAKLARAIASATMEYLSNYERRVGAPGARE